MSSDTAIRCGVLIGVSAGDSQEDLIRCLRSVLAQSDVFDVTIFVAMETGLKIEHLPDLKFPNNVTLKIIDVQAATNLSVKLNRLIEEVQKTNIHYLFRLDPDDEMLPGRMATQVEGLLHSGLDALGTSAVVVVGKSGIQLKKRVRKTVNFDDLLKTNQFLHPTMAFRPDFFIKYGRYDEKLNRAQDWELWLRAMARGAKMGNLSRATTRIKINSATLTRRRDTSVIDKEILGKWGRRLSARHALKVFLRNLLFRVFGR